MKIMIDVLGRLNELVLRSPIPFKALSTNCYLALAQSRRPFVLSYT